MKTIDIQLPELQEAIDTHELAIEILWAMRTTTRLIDSAKHNVSIYKAAGFYELLKKAEHDLDIRQRMLARLSERYLKAINQITL